MSRDLSALTPDTRAAAERLLAFARSRGLNPVIQSTARTCAEQNALFAQGPTVTKVQGCRSWHVMGRAVDVHIGSENCADYVELATFWKELGGRWGGDFPGFPDCVHFELPHPTKTLAELCPDPSPGPCERSVTGQPGGFGGGQALPIFGAALGAALALTFVGGKRRRR
jgi:D-alanyl-D-alanine carboxypeptidase